MTAHRPPAGRWSCPGCGRYVRGEAVGLGRGLGHRPVGVPEATCPRCGPTVVFYERTAPVLTTEPNTAGRDAGQQQSLLSLDEVARASFLDVVRSLAVGATVSVNTVRARLDALEVPNRKRGALFNAAIAAGLIEPLYVEAGGLRVAAREPSTGPSAHAATVRLYRRTGATS